MGLEEPSKLENTTKTSPDTFKHDKRLLKTKIKCQKGIFTSQKKWSRRLLERVTVDSDFIVVYISSISFLFSLI